MNYIVMQRGGEYNDEITQFSKSDSGKPLLIYKSRPSAEKEVRKLTKEWLVKGNPRSYCYSFDELFGSVGVQEINRLLGVNLEDYEYDADDVFAKCTDEQLEIIVDHLNSYSLPYYVAECP